MTHLWEVEHPYYCSETNYYSNDATAEYRGWAAFVEEEGDSDLDMNLLFRWDWNAEEHTLYLFWMGQRKGLFRSSIVSSVVPDDEPAIRAWLEIRWAHLRTLWEPIAEVPAITA